jgi:hypothetical protein
LPDKVTRQQDANFAVVIDDENMRQAVHH